MLQAFIEGFLLGLGACVPIGPINILIMNHALKSYKSAFVFGFGAMSTDVVYFVIIYLGLVTFVNHPFALQLLGVLGAIFLAYMAYGIFKGRKSPLVIKDEVISKKGLLKIYLQGFLLTLVNPYTVVFWLSIAGYTVNKSLNTGMIIVGMFSSLLLWIIFMPYFVHQSKYKISQRLSYYISIGSSLLLGFFAVSLLVNLLK
ncbi:LysE family translocator [bacterium]|nr:LysE family translocator [bacterium]MBU1959140.1 LysE family translocator [bacterium]